MLEVDLAINPTAHYQWSLYLCAHAASLIAKLRGHWFFFFEADMGWIKFDSTTFEKPEVWQIGRLLSIDAELALAKLLRIWVWFDNHTEDGHAPSVTKELLDRSVNVKGFCDAMIEVGWMQEDSDGIALTNFDRHNGQTAKNRGLAANRKQKSRKSHDASVTKNEQKSDQRREEKRREENNTHTHTTRNDVPKDVPERIKIAFDRWCDFRLAIDGRRPDPISSEANLMKLCRLGEDKAERDIEFSILKSAKTILDSDNDFEKIAAERRNGSARPPERKRKTVQEMLDKAFPDRHKQPGGTGDG